MLDFAEAIAVVGPQKTHATVTAEEVHAAIAGNGGKLNLIALESVVQATMDTDGALPVARLDE